MELATASQKPAPRASAEQGRRPGLRPILFSASMVLAILAGRKTQTRRLITKDWVRTLYPGADHLFAAALGMCPYGQAGDKLWVRETFAVDSSLDALAPSDLAAGVDVEYLANMARRKPGRSFDRGKTRVSIHMTRELSRIRLELTDVRIERVSDISADDARAEGLAKITKDGGRTWKYGLPDRDGWPGTDDHGWPWHEWEVDPRRAFAKLWDQINIDRAPWSASPWVWCLTFQRSA